MTNVPPPTYYAVQQPTKPFQGQSIAALVLGVVGVFFFWLFAIIPVLAIIFGGVAMNGQRKAGTKASGMAIAGLVLGIVFTAIYALAIVVGLSADGAA